MTARLKLKTSKGLAAAGVVAEAAKKRQRRKVIHPDREGQFAKIWAVMTPCEARFVPARQHLFHKTRKWRFDFAWPHVKVAAEIEGGLFQSSATGHRSTGGVVRDMEKSNAAQSAGWCVLRYHANDLDKLPATMVAEILEAIKSRSQ